MSKCIHQITPLSLPIAGTEAISLLTEHSFPRHSHDYFGIGIITRGAQRSWSLIGQVEAASGDVIIVNPGEIHDGIPIDGPRCWQMIYFQPELLQQELLAEGRCADAILHPLIHDQLLSQHLSQLFKHMSQPDIESVALEEMLLFSLMHTSRHHILSKKHRPMQHFSVKRAKEYLDEMSGYTVTLSELADLCDISRFQLLRSFSHEFGITPHAYLMQRRVCQARNYLLQGKTLVEAALFAGFADQSHMTRAFARQFAMTPSRYQKYYLC